MRRAATRRTRGRRIAFGIALCATVGLPASVSASSTVSYPTPGLAMQVTANDAAVAIAITQRIDSNCGGLCSHFVAVQSPQLLAAAAGTTVCADVVGDASLLRCDDPLPSIIHVRGTPGSDTLTAGGTGPGVCPAPAVSLSGLGGADELRSSCAADTLDGGDGRDTLAGGAGVDVLDGGADADSLLGESGNDTLRGGDGRDLLVPDTGSDNVSGGPGIDTVSYEARTAAVVVNLGGASGNGESGEGDTIAADVENVVGGSGGDTLTGSGAANDIDGGPGADRIDPAGGSDVVDAGAGADQILAQDGVPDLIVCGEGPDAATVDAFDTLDGCESVTSSRALMPDVDNDGIAAPADCNDANAAIRPGLPDRPGDGIDGDCAGGDAGDVDNDGIAAPTDCNDANAAIRPGLPDRPGDGVDADCAGGDAAYPRVLTGWSHTFKFGRGFRFIRYTAFDLVDVPDGATVELVCRGLGCFKGVRRSRHARGATRVKLARHLRLARLRPKSVVEVRITRPDTVAKIIRLTTQKGNRDPVARILCRKPGSKAPHSCTRR